MSCDMTYEETILKMREVRYMDFSNWNGPMVGRHIYAAGKARIQGKHYDWPGYIRFPMKLYKCDDVTHLPFRELKPPGCWIKLAVMEHGIAEWHAMRNHFLKYLERVVEEGKKLPWNQPRKTAAPSPSSSQLNDPEKSIQIAVPQEVVDTNNMCELNPILNTNTVDINTVPLRNLSADTDGQILPNLMDDDDPMNGIVEQLTPIEIQENQVQAQAQSQAQAHIQKDGVVHLNNINDFGDVDLSELRRQAQLDFNDTTPENPRIRRFADILNKNEDNPPPGRAKRHNIGRSTRVRPEQIEINSVKPSNFVHQLISEEPTAVTFGPVITSTPTNQKNLGDAIRTSELAQILETHDIDLPTVAPNVPEISELIQPDPNAANLDSAMVIPMVELDPTDNVQPQIATNQERCDSIPSVELELYANGLPRERSADRAERALNEAMKRLGRNRSRTHRVGPMPQPEQVYLQNPFMRTLRMDHEFRWPTRKELQENLVS